ncbi:hypothetical protein [Streptomyces sp. NPDC050504]|uniref:hypothetical protein n=1 Tax=Streptomyces sp. NPDC050504 TaxID=3365618 RepID=UPI0037AE6C48
MALRPAPSGATYPACPTDAELTREPELRGKHRPDADCEYRAEVVATGPVGGGTARVVLGAFRTPDVRLMIGWLADQALRIADGLDPAPDVHWLDPAQRGALMTSGSLTQLPSAPAELRAWCADPEERRTAYDRLRAGRQFVLGAADHTGTYALWVVPCPNHP